MQKKIKLASTAATSKSSNIINHSGNKTKDLPENYSVKDIWNEFTDEVWYPASQGVSFEQAKANKPSTKLFDFVKLERNMKVVSTNISGIKEGDMIEGFDSSTGGLMRMHWIDRNNDYNMVQEEANPRINGKRFFSPCRMMIRSFLEYFASTEYLSPPSKKSKMWKASKKEREDQLESFSNKLYGTHLKRDKLQSLLSLSDNLPNHRDVGGNDLRFRMQVFRLPDDMVKDIQTFFGDSSQDVISALIEKNEPYWHVHDLVSFHTRVKGTTSLNKKTNEKAPVMTFRRGVWKVVKTLIDNKKEPDIVLEKEGNIYCICKDGGNIHIKVSASNKNSSLSFCEWYKILFRNGGNCTKYELQCIDELDKIDQMKMMQTVIYKSLMQKLIRFQPLSCKILGTNIRIPSKMALVYCMYKVLYGPPQYLPTLHRSIQGPENVAKRLAVIAFEDSNPESVEEKLHNLLGAALLSQAEPTWFPSNELIKSWFQVALKLQEEPCAVYYENKSIQPTFPVKNFNKYNSFGKSACLLRIIRSFEGDMRMVEYLANCIEGKKKTRGALKKLNVTKQRPEYMPYPEHGLDQHVKPSLIYFLPDDNTDYPEASTTFGGRVQKLFCYVTGMNPRRELIKSSDDFENNSFVKVVRDSQRKFIKLWNPPNIEPSSTLRSYKFGISDDFLAGGLGAWNIGRFGGVAMSASLNPFDVNSIVCSPSLKQRNVSLDKVNHVFDKAIQDRAKVVALEILRSGDLRFNKINQKSTPIDIYNWCVKKEKGEFYLSPDKKKWTKWKELKSFSRQYPATDTPDYTIDLITPYRGMSGPTLIKEAIQKYKRRILQRALTYLNHYNSSFKMAVVDRAGGTAMGSEPVDKYDAHTFKFFLSLSRLAPYALRPSPTRPFEFKVSNPLLLQDIRKTIEEVSNGKQKGCKKWEEDNYVDKEGRELYDFQKESISRLLNERQSGRKRHFMRLPVGMGKTLITLKYLAQRGLSDVKYIVYTMPKSAFGSVISEIVTMGFRVCIYTNYQQSSSKQDLDDSLRNIGEGLWTFENQVLRPKVYNYPKKNAEMPKFHKGTIIVIEHDGLRKYKEALMKIITSSIFIIDEVHKCLLNSLRSGAALTLSRLAYETIAFTGTPILNKNGTKLLIRWLEANVKFKITEENFVVATNAMISYSPRTQVKEIEVDYGFSLKNEEYQQHEKYLKKGDLYNMIKICQKACTKKIVKLVCNERCKKNSNGSFRKVFVVAENARHQEELFLELKRLRSSDMIACLNINNNAGNANIISIDSIDLTDQKVNDKKVVDYDIIITRQRYNAGYNLTRMTVMITGIYFGNEADRIQLRGRINRLSQNNDSVYYISVFTGILGKIHKNYEKVKIAAKCLQSKQVSVEDMRKLCEVDNNDKRSCSNDTWDMKKRKLQACDDDDNGDRSSNKKNKRTRKKKKKSFKF